jgi:predicted ATPase
MLEMLHLKNVGPANEMKLEFGSRLNVITGDNGLGKSFILDCAFWMLSRRENKKILPKDFSLDATMLATVHPENNPKKSNIKSLFLRTPQKWDLAKDPVLPDFSIVIYETIENNYLICDRLSESQKQNGNGESNDRFFEFTPDVLWDGDPRAKPRINGLIRDMATWKLKNQTEIEVLRRVLNTLSPEKEPSFELGDFWNFDLADVRDIPTVKTYGEFIPITQTSSGFRRILTFAYVLVWTYLEHLRAAKATNIPPTNHIILLIDEIDQHLHPKWQRSIIAALIEAVEQVVSLKVQVQIITTTHSPLVMQSLETVFDPEKDAWFDLDFDKTKKEVVLEKREFFKRGTLDYWITSEAFDEPTAYNPEAQAVMDEVSAVLKKKLTVQKARSLNKKLLHVLSDIDPFWARWHMALKHQGIEL